MSLKRLKKQELVELVEKLREQLASLSAPGEGSVSQSGAERVAQWAWELVVQSAREAKATCVPSAVQHWQSVCEAPWDSLPQADRDRAIARVKAMLG
jgi:hypothetical protein